MAVNLMAVILMGWKVSLWMSIQFQMTCLNPYTQELYRSLGNFQGKFIVQKDKMVEYGRALCVRGYHVYREIWEAAVGQASFFEK